MMERKQVFNQLTQAWQQLKYHEGMLENAHNEKLREHHKWWMGYHRGRVSGLQVALKMVEEAAEQAVKAAEQAAEKMHREMMRDELGLNGPVAAERHVTYHGGMC